MSDIKFQYIPELDLFEISGATDDVLYYNDYLETISSKPGKDNAHTDKTVTADDRSGIVLKVICTNQCNLNCKYCYSRKETCGRLTFDVLKERISFAASRSVIRKIAFVGGGEPSLESDLIRKTVEYCKEIWPDISFSLQTNGTFDSDFMAFLVMNDFDVIFSLDGPYALVSSFQDMPYPESTHKKIEDNIRYFLSSSDHYQVNCVRYYDTDVEITTEEILDYLYSLGVRQISLNVNYEHWLKEDIDILQITNDLYAIVKKREKWKGLKLIIPMIKGSNYSLYRSGRKCSALYKTNCDKLTILPDGFISYCHRDQKHKVSLSQISQDEHPLFDDLPCDLQQMLNDLKEYSADNCSSCIARQICNMINCPYNVLHQGKDLQNYCNNIRQFRMGLIRKYLGD